MITPDGEASVRDRSEPIALDPSAGERILVEIGEDECFALLGTQDLGRLAVVHDGAPDIFPVNYALDDRIIEIRTQPGVKLTASRLARVAFEVEDIDATTREGWVVVVHGIAQDVTNAIDQRSEHARAAGARPWVTGTHESYITISHIEVSGRRLQRPA